MPTIQAFASTKPLEILEGINGTLEVYTDRIVIWKHGLLARFTLHFQGESRTIYLHEIKHIHFESGRYFGNGTIEFSLEDENIVLVFNPNLDPVAHKITTIIHSELSGHHWPLAN